jgi:hypothetical protein
MVKNYLIQETVDARSKTDMTAVDSILLKDDVKTDQKKPQNAAL